MNEVLAKVEPAVLSANWRLVMYAVRATMDGYTKQRFDYESARERRAMVTLAAAMGSAELPAAIAQANFEANGLADKITVINKMSTEVRMSLLYFFMILYH
jgi:hypothetical protein